MLKVPMRARNVHVLAALAWVLVFLLEVAGALMFCAALMGLLMCVVAVAE